MEVEDARVGVDVDASESKDGVPVTDNEGVVECWSKSDWLGKCVVDFFLVNQIIFLMLLVVATDPVNWWVVFLLKCEWKFSYIHVIIS